MVKPTQTPDGLCCESALRNSRGRRKKGERRDSPSHGSDASGAPQPSKYSTACKRHGIGHTIVHTNKGKTNERERRERKRKERTLLFRLFFLPSLFPDQAAMPDKRTIAVRHTRRFRLSSATVSDQHGCKTIFSLSGLTTSRETLLLHPSAPISVNGGVRHTDCEEQHQTHSTHKRRFTTASMQSTDSFVNFIE
jgi:hypothetical protein